jgi:hypothetical protein
MRKSACFALIGALGVAAAALSAPADAGVVVGVGVPGVVLAPPVVPVAYPPIGVSAGVPVGVYPAFYGHRYPHRVFYPGVRFGYGYYHHGWYRGRYWR